MLENFEGLVPQKSDDWRLEARCIGIDPEVFYPEQGDQAWEVKRLCQGCPVRIKCLEWAIEVGDEWGIWGGVGPKDRIRITRARKRNVKFSSIEDYVERLDKRERTKKKWDGRATITQ